MFRLLVLCLMVLSLNTMGMFAQESVTVTALDWSPDGETLAIGGRISEEGTIWLYDTLGTPIETINLSGTVLSVSWNPDGTRLAARYVTARGTQLSIWDWESFNPNTPQITIEELIGTNERYRITWSPTGRYIALNSSVWIHIIDAEMGQHIAQLHDMERTGTAGVLDVAWGIDEQSVYVLYEIRDSNQILQWDIHTSQIIQTIMSRENFFSINMEKNTDGNHLAVSEGHGSVVILRVPDSNIEQELIVSQGDSNIPYVSHLIWSKDNKELYGLADDGTLYLWDVVSGDLKAVDALIPDPASFLRDSAISPYGGRLAISVRWRPGASPPPETFERNTPDQFLLDGTVQIIVPAPSLERLQAIAEACNAPTTIEQSLTASIEADRLTEFVTKVESLPAEVIPPACRADLLAVAEALVD